MLDTLRKEDFEKCLNEIFFVEVEGQEPLETRLEDVQGLEPADDYPDRREPFSLIFRGPDGVQLQQSVFHLRNETLGELDLFLVTLGPDRKEGMRHEAVFT